MEKSFFKNTFLFCLKDTEQFWYVEVQCGHCLPHTNKSGYMDHQKLKIVSPILYNYTDASLIVTFLKWEVATVLKQNNLDHLCFWPRDGVLYCT